jgi:hypothetical protein
LILRRVRACEYKRPGVSSEIRVTRSLIYRSAPVYEAVMIGLYGRHYAARYRAISQLVPDGVTVLELCCGPGYLYQRHLRGRSIWYHGIDINRQFVDRVVRLGATGEVADVAKMESLPWADFVIMQASLYHFLPDTAPIVDRMLAAARRNVIIAEPIRNLSTARIPLISCLAKKYADPGSGKHQQRFDEQSLDEFMSRYEGRVSRSFMIPGGREKVYVLASS